MSLPHLVFGFVCIVGLVVGIMYVATTNVSITNTSDTYGNHYSAATNGTIQTAQTAVQGADKIGPGFLIGAAILASLCLVVGFVIFKRY